MPFGVASRLVCGAKTLTPRAESCSSEDWRGFESVMDLRPRKIWESVREGVGGGGVGAYGRVVGDHDGDVGCERLGAHCGSEAAVSEDKGLMYALDREEHLLLLGREGCLCQGLVSKACHVARSMCVFVPIITPT